MQNVRSSYMMMKFVQEIMKVTKTQKRTTYYETPATLKH